MAKDKKDISVLIEGQLPEFISSEHPKFKKFIEKYYEFLESHELYFDGVSFDEFKLVPEDANFEFFIYEDDGGGVEHRIQLESERDTAGNANLQFVIGETVTGNTSGATALVTGTKGNTHAFVKPTNNAVFQYSEKITGGTSRAYSTLANGVIDGTFPAGAIESFRSRGAVAATRELPDMQDIDKTNEGLIDDAWKKEFYTNIPRTTTTDRRQLLKRMKSAYRSKGNESSFAWLFRTVFAKEDVEFYYPKTDLMRLSDGRWTLDKTIKIVTAGATNIGLFTGRRITGLISRCSAIVEKAITSAVGNLSITEMTLSDVIQGVDNDGVLGVFKVNETVTTEVDSDGNYGTGEASGLVKTISVDVGGTEYGIGDEVTITGGGGQDAKARVGSIAENVVEGITIVDSGDGYVVGDVLEFVDEGTGGTGAAGRVGTIIKTGEVIVNSDQVGTYQLKPLSESDFGQDLIGHNANTHLFGNSSLIFQSTIKTSSAKYFDATGPMWGTQFITAGDQLRKQETFDETSVGQLTQSGTTVTFATGMTHQQTRDVIGAKLTYANSNTNIITGYTNTTVFSVRDTHTISSAQNWDIYYGSNTTWATVIGANSTQLLYAVGSYYRDPDLDVFSANNFANQATVILYDASRNKAWAAKSANSHDSQMMHNGITLQIGNTPASVNTESTNATANISYVDAFGQTGASNTVTFVTRGALATTLVDVGAIDTCTITAGGEKYLSEPVVSVANSYITSFNSALDVLGANNALVNINLHSYDTGTISQTSNVVTLTSGTFPDANSGILKLIYANGSEDFITAVTNSTSLRTSTEKNFGVNDPAQTYSLTYMAMANNFARNSYLYNDDYSARAVLLDFVDEYKEFRPPVATGNTTFRLDMLTANDFSSTTEYVLMEDTSFVVYEDHPDQGLNIGSSRLYNEVTTAERVTAYSSTVSTANSGTIAQSGATITLTGASFPNDVVRGTITYSGHDDSTAIITGYTNSTVITVDTSKTINASNTYSINYNGVVTWGINRTVTAAGSGTGNRTVTITDTAHYLRTGDRVSITGALSALVNGTHTITVIDSNSYSFTLPHDGIASVTGEIRSRIVASAWLSSYNTYTVDTSPKGNNATISVSAIAIGAIKTVDVYNFGAGYTEAPTITTTTGNRNAELSATLGAFAEYAGFYVGSIGLISGTPKIQDNFYYQDFSYVLKTDLDITDYRDSVKRLTHPSGMLLFGEVAFRNKVSVEMFDAAERNINTTEDDTGKTAATADVPKFRLTLPTINSYANVRYQTIASNNELEIYTAGHPWQAMDGRIEGRDDEILIYENFRDVTMQRTSAVGSNTYATITDTLHNLEVGDTITISGDRGQWASEGDYFNGKYTVYTVPTTNTYTVQLYRGDPGASVSASAYLYVYMESEVGQILLEDGRTSSSYASVSLLGNVLNEYSDDDVLDSIRVETTSFANVWRTDTSNWDAPLNGNVLDEANETILLERGGSFLYPTLVFPSAESGTVSIDMSFNSDVLLEDRTAGDLGMSDSGYLLDEAAGGAGNGPARYISLEEDTEGIEEGHIAQSIPYMETEVITSLLDSMRHGLLTEDGLDDLVLEPLATDTHDLFMEDGFKLLQDDGRTGYNSASTLGFFIVEFEESSWSTRPVERQRFITEEIPFKKEVREYEFDLVDTSGWHFVMEDSSEHLTHEDGTRALTEEGHVKIGIGEVEYNLVESTGWHILAEDDYTHLIYEDETRLLTEASEIQSTLHIPIISDDILTWNSNNHGGDVISNSDYDSRIVTSTYGLQAFRPHNVSQWPLFDTGMFADDNFAMEDNTGVILLEHPLLNRNYLKHEDYPAASEDIMNPHKEVLDFILQEDGSANFILYEEDTITGTSQGLQRALLETSYPAEEGYSSDFTPNQFWSVIPAYQYFHIPSRLSGEITFADEGTAGTGAATLFTTELKVGDEFETAGENIINEDSGGGILFESDERLEHEGPIVGDLSSVALTTEILALPIKDLRWMMVSEDSPTAAHSSHTNVLGNYYNSLTGANPLDPLLETYWILTGDSYGRGKMELEQAYISDVASFALTSDVLSIAIEDFTWYLTKEDSATATHSTHTNTQGVFTPYDNSGISDYESTWIINEEESNATSGNHNIGLDDDSGLLDQEGSQWFNNNILHEDLSKQIIVEPQAFIVGSITNDTSLTVTRKHLGGVSDSVFQM